MKVSVVIRTHNRGYVIGEAIASALAQTYDDFEIIVVDDASTDNTFEVVQQFRSDKIRYFRHDRNCGVSGSGNTGIRMATGDVIAHLDSDDLWKPETLGTLVDFLNRYPEADAVFCDVEVIRREEPVSSIAASMHAFPKLLALHSDSDDVIFNRREMYLCLLEEVPIKPTGVLIRRYVFDTVGGYDESWVSGEDWELYLRISKCYRFGYKNRKLATMRVYNDSTLLKNQEQDKISLIQLEIKEKRTVREDPEALRAVNRAISRHHKDLGWIYLHSGRRMKSISTYARGFAETGHLHLALRAALALIPLFLRTRLRHIRMPAGS